MFDLTGKKALVTGATQGIGFETAKLLAEHGATVYVNGATSEEKCKSAAAQIRNAVPVRANIADEAELEHLFAATGDIDILVCNASIQTKKAWDEYTAEDFDVHMDVNVKSTFLLIKHYAAAMKAKGHGRIVTVGSVNQFNNHPKLALYGMTKAAQYKFVRNIAPSLAPFGVTVNNVSPGAVETPRNDEALADAAFRQAVINSIPAGRIGVPADIAPAILFLCSDEAAYVTGADLTVDGGMSL